MFTVSGIILDTAKKERMRGGIRITVLGEVLFDGQDVTNTEPSQRARKGLDTVPGKKKDLQRKLGHRKSEDRWNNRQQERSQEDSRLCLHTVPRAGQAPQERSRISQWR